MENLESILNVTVSLLVMSIVSESHLAPCIRDKCLINTLKGTSRTGNSTPIVADGVVSLHISVIFSH